MSVSTKTAELRSDFDTKHAMAKEAGLLGDPVYRDNMEHMNAMVAYLETLEHKSDWSNFNPGQFLAEWQRRCAVPWKAAVPLIPSEAYLNELEKGLLEIRKALVGLDEGPARFQEEMIPVDGTDNEDYDGDENSVADSDVSHYELSESDEICEVGAPAQEILPELSSPPRPAALSTVSLEALSQQMDLLVAFLSSGKQTFDSLRSLVVTVIHGMAAYARGMGERSGTANERSLLIHMRQNMDEATKKLGLWPDTPEELKELLNVDLQKAFSALNDALNNHEHHRSESEQNVATSRESAHQIPDAEKIFESSTPAATSPHPQQPSPTNPPTTHRIALERYVQQTQLLRKAVTKRPSGPKDCQPIFELTCRTTAVLKACYRPERLQSNSEHDLVASISSNIDITRAVFESWRLPRNHFLRIAMGRLSEAFEKLLNELSSTGDNLSSRAKTAASMAAEVSREESQGDSVADAQSVTGGSDSTATPDDKCRCCAGSLEHMYGELLKQNVETRGETALTPCPKACMKLASLLQMRNSFLEHQIRELQDTNNGLLEDVDWHVNALAKLEDDLKEAQLERAAALAEVLDLKARTACSPTYEASSSSAVSDEEVVNTDMTSSYSYTPLNSGSTNIVTERAYGSQQRDRAAGRVDAPEPPSSAEATASHAPATAFYFFPKTATILLPSTPPHLFQWPLGTTLPQIYQDLVRRYENGDQNDPLFQILAIFDLRACHCIGVPDPLSDEVIKVSAPDLDEGSIPDHDQASGSCDELPLFAWEAFDMDPSWDEQDWDNWWCDVVQPSTCSSFDCAYSEQQPHHDGSELFSGWSWGNNDGAAESDYPGEREVFARTRVNHVVPDDTSRCAHCTDSKQSCHLA